METKSSLKPHEHQDAFSDAAIPLIDRLPEEILSKIIMFWLSDVDGPPHYKKLHVIAQVRCSWKSLVLGTPSFWSELSTRPTEREADLALRRSANHLLSITIEERRPSFLSKVVPLLQRWKALYYRRGMIVSGEDEHFLTEPAPHLETVDISGYSLHSEGGPWDLFFGQADRLRNLRLSSCSCNWDSPILRRLWRLELYSIKGNAPTFTQLFQVLSACPELHTLILDGIFFKHSTGDQSSNIDDVYRLPSLCDLRLLYFPVEEMDDILKRLPLPSSIQAIYIAPSNRPSSIFSPRPSSFGDICTRLMPYISKTIDQAQRIQIVCDQRSFKLEVEEESRDELKPSRLSLKADYEEFLPTVSSICAAHPSSTITSCTDVHLTPAGHIVADDADTILEALESFAQVEFLRLRTPDARPDEIVNYLKQPFWKDHVLHWPLPRLRFLCINVEAMDLDDLLDMIESRYATGNHPRTGKKKQLPVPFSTLQLIGTTYGEEDYLEAIKEIVGSDVLDCDDVEQPSDSDSEY